MTLSCGGKLAGRPGEHDDQAARLGGEGAARGGAVVVLDHVAALGEPGLLLLVLAHLLLVDVVENPVQAGLVELEFLPGAGGGGLLGQVVGGGPQAPGHNQQLAAGDGRLHRVAQALHVVPHHGGVQQVDPQPGQGLGHNSGVSVHHLAQQKLGAHRNDFSVHGTSSFYTLKPYSRAAWKSSQLSYSLMIPPLWRIAAVKAVSARSAA